MNGLTILATCLLVGLSQAFTQKDDLLYLHGQYVRKLTGEETLSFKKYQNTLSLLRQLKDAIAKGSTLLNNGSMALPIPSVPAFCEGFDDQPEVVLDGCTVRHDHVYIENKVVRPLNELEMHKIRMVIGSFSTLGLRAKRDTTADNVTESVTTTAEATTTTALPTTPTEPSTTTQKPTSDSVPVMSDELKEIISQALNVNREVADRFFPIASMSPLLKQSDAPGQPNGNVDELKIDDKQKQQIRDFIQDHIMRYQSKRSKSLNELHKVLKPHKTAAPTTEIPHLVLDGFNQQQQMRGPSAGLDPALLQLLHGLAAQAQPGRGYGYGAAKAEGPRFPGAAPMKPGDVVDIGGQTYVAVPLRGPQFGEAGQLGLIPALPPNSHTVTAQPPPPPLAWPQPESPLRYHPGKRRAPFPPVPSHVNGIPLPHDVCRLAPW